MQRAHNNYLFPSIHSLFDLPFLLLSQPACENVVLPSAYDHKQYGTFPLSELIIGPVEERRAQFTPIQWEVMEILNGLKKENDANNEKEGTSELIEHLSLLYVNGEIPSPLSIPFID